MQHKEKENRNRFTEDITGSRGRDRNLFNSHMGGEIKQIY